MSKKPGMIWRVSSTETRVSMIHLVKRSSAKTAPAIPSAFRRGLLIPVGMVIIQYSLRTCAANGGESGSRSDIGGVLPATLALDARGPLHFHGDVAAGRGLVKGNLRNDEQAGQLPCILL